MFRSLHRVLRQSYLFTLICISLVAIAVSCGVQTQSPRTGMPYDWSHHYIVFGGTSASPDIMRAVQEDARYWHQRTRQAPAPQLRKHINIDSDPQRVDWSVNLGGAASALADGQFPAKYTFQTNAPPDCVNDYVVFALNVAGSSSQATIVAYNNLYSEPGGTGFCAGTGPKVKWAYNTGGAINTSPSLSTDGAKVAWVANANPPVLHVLTIGTTGNNGTSVTSPAVAGTGNNAVDTTVSYGGVGDTRSSVFVDYKHDTAYVASDAGAIHKFSGVFRGTPSQVTTGGWPLHIIDSGNHAIVGPVFDQTSHNLYWADDIGTFSYFREVGSTVGVCISQPTPPCWGQVTFSLTQGANAIFEPPIVDAINQKVYVFVGNNGQGTTHLAEVLQTNTALTLNNEKHVGIAGTLFSGAFDTGYYTTPQTGHLYTCGYPASGTTASPILYRFGFDGTGTMSTHDTNSLALSSTATHCSPMTEFFNTTTGKDWLFVGVENGCAATGGTACVMSMDISSGFPSAITEARAEAGGTSGIVIDNVSSAAQASSIYFSTLSTTTCGDGNSGGGCAVKLTQAGLN